MIQKLNLLIHLLKLNYGESDNLSRLFKLCNIAGSNQNISMITLDDEVCSLLKCTESLLDGFVILSSPFPSVRQHHHHINLFFLLLLQLNLSPVLCPLPLSLSVPACPFLPPRLTSFQPRRLRRHVHCSLQLRCSAVSPGLPVTLYPPLVLLGPSV